ncbi:MAG: arylesterase [Acidobacteria bacterium]|nr:arylesterase [Acidobacteriota bacterium]
MRRVLPLFLLCVAVAPGACSREPSAAQAPAPLSVTDTAAPPRVAPVPADAPGIAMLGDSLTAGLGLDTPDTYPSLIEGRLRAEGIARGVLNAGVSGDTSAGGLRRLPWVMETHPTILLVALGGNDALRGLPVADLRRNLAAIIEGGQQGGALVILAGMEAPPNNGPEYTSAFREVYRDLAREYDVPLIPFLLDGVAGDPALNQVDGIHPNPEGARRVADVVWRALTPHLSRLRSSS